MDRQFAHRLLAISLAAAICTAVATGCGGSSSGGGTSGGSATGTPTLTMGTSPWLGYGPWFIVEKKGFDAKNGFELKLSNFVEEEGLFSSFGAGQVDATNAATNQVIQHAKNWEDSNTNFVLPLFEDSSEKADAIIADESIKDVADLKGQSVAYQEGSTSDLLLHHALEEEGIEADEINPVLVEVTAAGAALIAGKVPAAGTFEPYISAALNQNKGIHVLYEGADAPGLISDVLVVNKSFADENPEVVEAALTAWNEAVEFYNSNKSEAEAIIAEAIGANVDELKSGFDGVKLYTLAESQEFLKKKFPAVQKMVTETLIKQGLVESDPDIESVVDTRYGE